MSQEAPKDDDSALPAAAPIATTPPTVDPLQFTRRKMALSGLSALAGFERLADADVAADGHLAWSIAGSVGRDEMGRQREFLDLHLNFSPVMTCARCLEPVRVGPLDIRRRFRLAASERQADIEDREVETVDVIAAGARLSLADLIEDEALLSLPMAPTHPTC